jgi:transposase-like protein
MDAAGGGVEGEAGQGAQVCDWGRLGVSVLVQQLLGFADGVAGGVGADVERHCQVGGCGLRLVQVEHHEFVDAASLYKGYRFPVEIISHCVWLYHRFPLSFREIEEMMAQRGVIVSYETIRAWCARFGPMFAQALRRRQPRRGDRWHLDEVFLTINGQRSYLWRAVDQDGNVLDILVTSRRDARSAKRFFRTLLKGLRYVPRVVVTDKLRSYGAALRQVLPSVEELVKLSV